MTLNLLQGLNNEKGVKTDQMIMHLGLNALEVKYQVSLRLTKETV